MRPLAQKSLISDARASSAPSQLNKLKQRLDRRLPSPSGLWRPRSSSPADVDGERAWEAKVRTKTSAHAVCAPLSVPSPGPGPGPTVANSRAASTMPSWMPLRWDRSLRHRARLRSAAGLVMQERQLFSRLEQALGTIPPRVFPHRQTKFVGDGVYRMHGAA